jgi:hypothetical protein
MFKPRFSPFRSFFFTFVWIAVAILYGCASVGTPGGGLYDETPPAYRTSKPAQGATNVRDRKITIHFDENIKLDNVMEKLVVSPPQGKAPSVLSNAKTVTVELLDTLIPNTTYTLDFGNAIQDNNEGNELEHFSLTFSTGEAIDSMRVGGYLLNAENLEPITGAYVGLYPDSVWVNDSTVISADSAFRTRQMPRAGKSDAYGAFTINGVAPGRYRIFALTDGNSNYRYDLFTEDIAYLDTLIVPTAVGRLVSDTIWADSLTIDTILTHGHIEYGPSDLRLLLFNEGRTNLYMDDYARPDSAHLTFRFSGPMPHLPEVYLLGDTVPLSEPRLLVEPSAQWDTVTYWLADSLLYNADTLHTAVTYYYTDTLYRDVPRTDTLHFVRPVVRPKQDDNGGLLSNLKGKAKRGLGKKKGADAPTDSLPPITYMTLKALMGGTLNIGSKPMFEVSAPLTHLDTAGIHLELKVDSLWQPLPHVWQADTTHLRRYQLSALPHFTPGSTYRLRVDSAAMHDIFGAPINATSLEFRERMPEDYAHLLFRVSGVKGPAFVQLLNEKDKPLQQAPVEKGQAKFIHVTPGSYYARLVVDTNDNGRFDAGNLAAHRQPEQVYYYPQKLELRANWQFSQDWNVSATDLLHQKPDDLKQNKPKKKEEKKSRNAEYMKQHGIKQ